VNGDHAHHEHDHHDQHVAPVTDHCGLAADWMWTVKQIVTTIAASCCCYNMQDK